MNTKGKGTTEYINWLKEDKKQKESEGLYTIDGEITNIKIYSRCNCFCRHFIKIGYNLENPKCKCAAFDDIPLEIWQEEFDHSKPYPNDRGIRFSE
jgi:hypothetical protein